jgi:hypothetical protein
MAPANPKAAQDLQRIVGHLFSDQAFAKAMEKDPEQALKQAGFQLDPQQLSVLRSGRSSHTALAGPDPSAVAAFVSPVVSVVTSGTQPVVNVVVTSAVVASAEDKNK